MRCSIWMHGFGVMLMGSIIGAAPTHGSPAPVFAPIISEVRQKLPAGLQMRLPAYLPEHSEPLYPFVRSNSKGLQVYITSNATCKQPNCTLGGIGVFTQEGFTSWRRQLKNATPVKLPNDIQGYYLRIGDAGDQYVLWQQDGSNFVIGADNRALSQQQLVEMAASMVNESPID